MTVKPLTTPASIRITALARQLADNAHAGIPYGDILAELIGARQVELHGVIAK